MGQVDLDAALRESLEACAGGDPEYWTFRENDERHSIHAYFQYPAMMVPQVLERLIEILLQAEPDIKQIYDPFVGSGTVLGEAVLCGREFFGQDINPLAILICRAKAGPLDEVELGAAIERVLATLVADEHTNVEVTFPNLEKWFNCTCSIALSKIRRAISQEALPWVRQFLWVGLAETVRLSSNSRTSTYKLHKRPDEELEKRTSTVNPQSIFEDIIRENFTYFQNHRATLLASNLIDPETHSYKHRVEVRLGDSAQQTPVEVAARIGKQHLLVTSPPYGDNQTTVPYGQAAYLPLQWIPLEDIDPDLTDACLRTTHEIDTKSLGGGLAGALARSQPLRELSPAFAGIMASLEGLEKKDFAKKVASFCWDLYQTIDSILAALRPSAPMVWIVGNRNVGGFSVPLDEILAEMLAHTGATEIATLNRRILSKRMPSKNANAPTMGSETILIWRTAPVAVNDTPGDGAT